jgi:tRNA(fMet)-specific endonuclease VapC
MVILDTDHLSLLHFPESEAAVRIMSRLSSMGIQQAITTIITYEEQTRGWLKEIAGAKDSAREIEAYRRSNRNRYGFCAMQVLDFEEDAASEFQRLRRMKVRIGTMDLKIAAITLVRDATLLSGNLRDFRKVPGLKVEDWSSR